MSSLPEFDFTKLTIPERLDLISALWDSIPDSDKAFPMPDWHRRELERRLAEADANPDAAIPWEDVKKRLNKKP